jgi:hypothetical protein
LVVVYPIRDAPESSDGIDHPAAASADDNDDDWVSLREAILDSTFAGAMVRSVVDVHTGGEGTGSFSIFGLGNFALEATSGGGAVELSEISNGWSVTLTPHRGGDYVDLSKEELSDLGPKRAPALRWLITVVVGYLTSPLGIVLETLAALLALFWLVIRGVALMRENQFSSARLVPNLDGTEPASTRKRRRRRRSRRHRRHRKSSASS